MISSEGMETIQFGKKSFDSGEIRRIVIQILEIIRRRKEGRWKKVAIFLDNSPLHRGDLLKTEVEKMNVGLIYNLSCSPDLNIIEFFFEIASLS